MYLATLWHFLFVFNFIAIGCTAAPTSTSKRYACLLGAVVADAAARPFHWVYDGKVIDRALSVATASKHPNAEHTANLRLSSANVVAFHPVSISPYYTVPLGHSSVYGDAAVSMLKSIAHRVPFEDQLLADFGPGSAYWSGKQNRVEDQVLQAPWLDDTIFEVVSNILDGHSQQGFLGGEDADGFTVNLPLFLLEGENLNMADHIRTICDSDLCVDFGDAQYAMLEAVLSGGTTADAIDAAREILGDEEIDEVYQLQNVSHRTAVEYLGADCAYPASFLGALHAIITSSSSSSSSYYKEAVEQTIIAGGDTSSRAMFLGAFYGARDGIDAIPQNWISQTSNKDVVEQLWTQASAAVRNEKEEL